MRRRLDLQARVARVRRPLWRQPAGLVGLVPDRPVVDPRQAHVRPVVAPAHGLNELPELLGVGSPCLLQALLRGLLRGPARDRRRDVQVHEDAARKRRPDQVVVLLPQLRRVGAGIGRVEVRLLHLVGRRRDDRPEDRHADAVDAEGAQLVQRALLDLGRPIDQTRVVLEHRLLRLGGRGRRGEGRQHEGGKNEGEKSVHLVDAPAAAICLRA